MSKLVVKAETEETTYLQVVYAEVYAPDRLDAHNEFMTRDEIRKAAWKFMAGQKTRIIDVEHDNEIIQAVVVESFIASDDDKIFIPGSWVIGVHIEDPKVWAKVLSGELNGFSMEAWVVREERDIEVQFPAMVKGETSENSGHTHVWYVRYEADGTFGGGGTNMVNGHSHLIRAGTITDVANGHAHTFSTVDELAILPVAILS